MAFLGLGLKNDVSAIQVAEVPSTRYEIHFVGGNHTENRYTWMTLRYQNGVRRSYTVERRDWGINPAYLYTYSYTTY